MNKYFFSTAYAILAGHISVSSASTTPSQSFIYFLKKNSITCNSIEDYYSYMAMTASNIKILLHCSREAISHQIIIKGRDGDLSQVTLVEGGGAFWVSNNSIEKRLAQKNFDAEPAQNIRPPVGKIFRNPNYGKSNQSYKIWGDYTTTFTTWKVIIIPKDTSTSNLIGIAKDIHLKYANTRVLIFNDDKKVEQYALRDIWFNTMDKNTVRQVSYPENWIHKHYVAEINDRSIQDGGPGSWQLVDFDSNRIATL